MIRLSELLGQQAVALGTAERTGRVKGVDIRANRIAHVAIDKQVIDASAVRSFEGDVLTYDEARAIISSSDDRTRDPRGMRVLDTHGQQLGIIGDLAISADGVVESIILEEGDELDGSTLRAIGSYAAVVGAAPVGASLPPPSGPPVLPG